MQVEDTVAEAAATSWFLRGECSAPYSRRVPPLVGQMRSLVRVQPPEVEAIVGGEKGKRGKKGNDRQAEYLHSSTQGFVFPFSPVFHLPFLSQYSIPLDSYGVHFSAAPEARRPDALTCVETLLQCTSHFYQEWAPRLPWSLGHPTANHGVAAGVQNAATSSGCGSSASRAGSLEESHRW